MPLPSKLCASRSLERMAQHWEGGGVFSPEVREQDVALLRRYDPYL